MRTVMFAAAIAGSLVACTVDDPLNTGATGQRAEIQNRLASNRLASNRLASNRLASNRLASNSISATRLLADMETAQLLEDEEGRDVYSYLISCALGDTSISADLSYLQPPPADTDCDAEAPLNCQNYECAGGVCTFYGNLGLAPRWADRKLDKAGRGWVSACMFSRVNATQTAEAISLRADRASLAVSAEEASAFNLEEGAFYGNLFTDDPDPDAAPDWNACRGRDKATNSTQGGLANRECAEEEPTTPGYTKCGFKYNGDCRDYTPVVPTPYACRKETSADGYSIYDDCYDSAAAGRWPRTSTRSREVLTVFVSFL